VSANPHTLIPPVEYALRAREAGKYLAQLVGIPEAFPPRKMWALARAEAVPVVRLNRDLWFRPADLRAFIAEGGTLPRRQRTHSSQCDRTS
jgi:hypothetical protein